MLQIEDLINQSTEWLKGRGEDSDIVLSGRIRLARNLADKYFVSRMSFSELEEVENFLKEKIFSLLSSEEYGYFALDELPVEDAKLLHERQLISKEHLNNKGRRSVICNSQETLSVMINEEDHLRIQMIGSNMSLAAIWKEMDKFIDSLEEVVSFAFDKRFGYLTSCPTNVGTGLRVSAMLHLPALNMTGQMPKIYHATSKVNLVIRGFFGEGTAALGDIFQISNQVTLGKSEEQLVSAVERAIPQIVDYERSTRKNMLAHHHQRLKQNIAQAWEKITEEKDLTPQQAIEHLSLLRLGIVIGLEKSLSLPCVHEMLLFSQDSHLCKRSSLCPEENLDRQRAHVLQKILRQYQNN